MTTLEFSSVGDDLLMTRAGIDQDFLDRINRTVTDIRNLKRAHPGVGRVVAHLVSPSGEDFQITID